MIYIFFGVCAYIIGYDLFFILVAYLTAHDVLNEMNFVDALCMCLLWPLAAVVLFLLTLPGLVETAFNNLVTYFRMKRRK